MASGLMLTGFFGGRPGPRLTIGNGSLLAGNVDLGDDNAELVRVPLTPLFDDLIMIAAADFAFARWVGVDTVLTTCVGLGVSSGLRGGRPGPRLIGMTGGGGVGTTITLGGR